MATVLDVAQYVLERRGKMSSRKLQKLVFFAQAWSLAWTNRPLFLDPIEAWRDGPVSPALFAKHRRVSEVSHIEGGDSLRLSDDQMDTVDSVLGFYGEKTAEELMRLSHEDSPWLEARRGRLPWQASKNVISHRSMGDFYARLARPARR